jgi:hypothetical protein
MAEKTATGMLDSAGPTPPKAKGLALAEVGRILD